MGILGVAFYCTAPNNTVPAVQVGEVPGGAAPMVHPSTVTRLLSGDGPTRKQRDCLFPIVSN